MKGLLVWFIGLGVATLAFTGAQYRYNVHQLDNGRAAYSEQDFKTGFDHYCLKDFDKSTCDCYYNYLDSRMTLPEMQKLDKDLLEGGEIPPIVFDAVDACI